MAGHSRWANIKHKKAKSDARRGKLWSKCVRAVMIAARNGGGDPASNLTLRCTIDEAKAANVPRDTIENAIRKATGEGSTDNYEAVIYEGYGPGGVAVMIEAMTNNRNRTVPDLKRILEKHGGNLGTTGCVGYIFLTRGQVLIPKTSADEETLLSLALEAGAEDVVDAGDAWQVLSEPVNFQAVRDAIDKAKLKIESSGITRIATMTVTCTGPDAQRILTLMEEIEDHDDVQKVHANFDIPEQELAALGG